MDIELSSEYVTMTFRDGILEGRYADLAVIDLEAAKLIVEQRKKATNYQVSPILIDGRKLKSIDKPARDYFASEAGSELLTAAALLADSAFTKHIGNFFLRISFRKQKIPIQLFTDREKAIEWLKQFRQSPPKGTYAFTAQSTINPSPPTH